MEVLKDGMKSIRYFVIIAALLILSSMTMQGAIFLKASSSVKVLAAGDQATITIYVTDHNNYSVADTLIKLSVVSGGGTIKPESITTNSVGVAKAVFTAADLPATNVIKVESSSAAPFMLSIESQEPPPAEFSVSLEQEKVYPETQTNIIIFVKNFKGKASPNVSVSLKPSNLQSLEPLTGKTDVKGRFTASVKTGKATGLAKVEVKAGSLETKVKEIPILPFPITTFNAVAEPYALYTQSNTTIKVKIADSRKNAVSGVKISFQVAKGEAVLEKGEAATDAKGTCSVKLKSGAKEGAVTVRVKVLDKDRAGETEPVLVNISVAKLILPPAKLEFSADHPFATTGDDVAFTARILDKEGNPVTGAAVTFLETEGGGRLSQEVVTTGPDGKATVLLSTGKKAGNNSVKAKCEQLTPVEVTIKTEGRVFHARKPAGAPAKFYAFLGKKKDRVSVVAVVTDKNFVPVTDVQIYFKVIKGHGVLASDRVNTDMSGTASVELTPKDYGIINIQVSAPALLDTKGLVYKKSFPIHLFLLPVCFLFAIALLIYLLLRGKSVKLRYLDPFTGLYNELFAKYRLKKAIKNKQKFTVFFLDFNHFKYFNNFNGHAKGNELIKAVADILKKKLEPEGVVCHLGGDDFVAILNHGKAEGLPEKLLAEISEKIESFYPDAERRIGTIKLKDEHGKEFSHPLASVAMAVLESDRFPAVNFNELLDKAGKVMKAAKSKGGNAVSYDVDYNSDIGRQYKIGWFTVIGFLLALMLPEPAFSQENTMILSAWCGETVATGRTVKVSAHVTDLKERPVSNAFILFAVEKGDGMLEDSYAVTDDTGNCVVRFTGGQTRGENIVTVYGEGLLPVNVEIKKRSGGIDVLIYFSLIMLTASTVLFTAKIMNMRLLLKGVDKDGGFRTRFFAEQYINKLSLSGANFVTTFLQFRDFQEYCKTYGYLKGDKIVKSLAEYIKEAVIANGGREDEIFYYWQDRFVIISPLLQYEEFSKDLIIKLNVSVSLFCEDKVSNFYSLHLLIAQIESQNLKQKGLEEIMDIGETLINKAKGKVDSSSITYSGYLTAEKAKPRPVAVPKQEVAPKAYFAPEKKILEMKHTGEEAIKIDAEKEKKEAAERLKKNMEELQKKNEASEKARKEAEEKAGKLEEEKIKKEADERVRKENEAKTVKETEARIKKQVESTIKKEMEQLAKRDAEEKTKREAEEKLRREADEKSKKELETRIREEVEEKARTEAAKREFEEKVRLEARERESIERESKVKREAEEALNKQKEENLRREAEEKAFREAEARLRKEAEEKARKLEEEIARRETEERARREAEEKSRLESEEKRRKEFEEKLVKELETRLGKEEERLLKEIEQRVRLETEEKSKKETQEKLLKELETRVSKEEAQILKEMGGTIEKDVSEKLKKAAEEKVIKNISSRVTGGNEDFMVSIEEKVKKEKEALAARLAEESRKESEDREEEKAKEETAKKEAELRAQKEAEERLVKEEKERAVAEKTKVEEDEKKRKEEEERKIKEAAAEEGKKDEEIVFAENQLAADPENLELHVKLADLYFAKNMKNKAVEKLLFLADNFYEARLHKYALKYYMRVIEIDPTCIAARIKIAQIYVHDDMDREAKLEFLSIAELYLEISDIAKAEEYAQKAIEFKSLEAHYVLGVVAYKRGMLKDAADEMNILLKIKPYHLKALQYLFYYYVASMDFMQALDTFDKILGFEEKHASSFKDYPKEGFTKEGMKYLMNEADSLVKKKLMTEAMKLVQAIIERMPSQLEARMKHASLLEAKGLFKEAAKGYRDAGTRYLRNGKREEAERCTVLADKLDPSLETKKEKKSKVSYL